MQYSEKILLWNVHTKHQSRDFCPHDVLRLSHRFLVVWGVYLFAGKAINILKRSN